MINTQEKMKDKSDPVGVIAGLLVAGSTVGLAVFLLWGGLIWLFVPVAICCIYFKTAGGVLAACLSVFFISWFFIGLNDRPFDYVAALYILALLAFMVGGILFTVSAIRR